MFGFKNFSTKGNLPSKEVKSSSLYDYTYVLTNKGQIQALNNDNIQLIIANYETIAPLYSAVTAVSSAVGGLPLVVKTKDGQIIKDHPVLDLINSPNKEEQQTKEALMSQLTIWRIIEGDAYLEATGSIDREPQELFILKPQNMNIQTDGTGFAQTYRFNSNSLTQTFTKQRVTGRIVEDNDQAELLHIKNFNPRVASVDPTGMSEVMPLFFEVRQYLESSNHNLSLLENGARPSGALTITNTQTGMPASLTEEQFARLKRQVTDCYEGSDNSGRPMILEGGLAWQEMGLSPRDMDFHNLKREAEQQIYKGLGVPIQMKTDAGSTFNNKAEARLEFYENRVFPLADEILSAMTDFLMPRYDNTGQLNLAVDKQNVDALAVKRAARTEMITTNTVLTLNEKREELGFAPVEGGDQVFTTAGLPIAGDVIDEEV